MFVSALVALTCIAPVNGAVYYFDPDKGDDASDWLSESTPEKTLAQLASSKHKDEFRG
ncbi:MAG: hypothetical protein J6T01_05960 [Kiritimatiellae bacterium]|nr:hypothetical protein [Kiritimatiellia bacterium]